MEYFDTNDRLLEAGDIVYRVTEPRGLYSFRNGAVREIRPGTSPECEAYIKRETKEMFLGYHFVGHGAALRDLIERYIVSPDKIINELKEQHG